MWRHGECTLYKKEYLPTSSFIFDFHEFRIYEATIFFSQKMFCFLLKKKLQLLRKTNWRNNWCYIIWQSRRTFLKSKLQNRECFLNWMGVFLSNLDNRKEELETKFWPHKKAFCWIKFFWQIFLTKFFDEIFWRISFDGMIDVTLFDGVKGLGYYDIPGT